jgi:hypothetical protein
VLDEDLGGGMWEVWGAYEIPLRRTDATRRASEITFRAGITAAMTLSRPICSRREHGFSGHRR